MRSFVSLAVIAAIAFAPFTLAIPAPPTVPLPAILTQLLTDLQPLTTELGQLASIGNVTVEALQPVTDEINTIIAAAVVEAQYLVGLPTNVILKDVDKILTVSEVATLVASVLALVLNTLGLVFDAVTTAEAKVIVPFLVGVGVSLGQLLLVIVSLVGGIVAVLIPFINDLVDTIFKLNLEQIITLLGLHN